jgi:hypothetical protein
MSWAQSPTWLLELQARFGQMLRTPLDRSTGTLRAVTSSYDARLVDATKPSSLPARERLAIYHRQYWARLLSVLQKAYPLTARLLGFWHFNELAARHLTATPPTGFDVEDIALGFEAFLATALEAGAPAELIDDQGARAEAIVEASRIDGAFQRVLRAPVTKPLRLTATNERELAALRLLPSPAIALVYESWAWCDERAGLIASSDETAVALPRRLPQPRRQLLVFRENRIGTLPLEAREGELLELLFEQPLGAALGALEARCSPEERERLPEQARAWLGRSVGLGVWSGAVKIG